MNGVFVVDKPVGPTSHDVVAVVRRATGIRRIGHTGTLDPLASGVLPLVVGRATRLAQFLSASDKEYVADIRIGMRSETYDAEGPLIPDLARPPADPSDEQDDGDDSFGFGVELASGSPAAIEAVLAEFRGAYWQMPPPHSAKKVGGVPAYKLARRHQAAELKPVSVAVRALDVLAIERDVLRLRVRCSSGFYVRSLAHDLGERLGCGAYLAALRRTQSGGFTEADAVPLAAIAREGFDSAAHLVPLNRLLPDLPALVLGEAGVRRVSHGNAVGPEHLEKGAASFPGKEAAPFSGNVRLLDGAGTLVAIAEWQSGGLLHPSIVLM